MKKILFSLFLSLTLILCSCAGAARPPAVTGSAAADTTGAAGEKTADTTGTPGAAGTESDRPAVTDPAGTGRAESAALTGAADTTAADTTAAVTDPADTAREETVSATAPVSPEETVSVPEQDENGGEEPGNDPASDPGNDPGNDPGSDPGNDPGGESGGEDPVPWTPAPPAPSVGIAELLNASPLHPMKTNCKALDELVDKIFAEILPGASSTYEKVRACYDYLVDTCSYGGGYMFLDPALLGGRVYKTNYDVMLIYNAYEILLKNVGVCDHYNAAFVVMCRRIGLDAYVVGGTVSAKAGGRLGHAWAEILLGGEIYTFDPQVQDNNPGFPYFYFGKTYAETGSLYECQDGAGSRAAFAGFESFLPPPADMKISLSRGYVTYTVSQSGNYTLYYTGSHFPSSGDGRESFAFKAEGGSGSYTVVVMRTVDGKQEILLEQPFSGETTVELDLTALGEEELDLLVLVADAAYGGSFVCWRDWKYQIVRPS